jgi:hypothetical protein
MIYLYLINSIEVVFMMCGKCSGITGWLLLIFGILFLLVDFGLWTFWNIKWWTILFVVAGIAMIASHGCGACASECCETPKKKK